MKGHLRLFARPSKFFFFQNQHSNTPLLQYSGWLLLQSLLSLTEPEGPGFPCQNQKKAGSQRPCHLFQWRWLLLSQWHGCWQWLKVRLMVNKSTRLSLKFVSRLGWSLLSWQNPRRTPETKLCNLRFLITTMFKAGSWNILKFQLIHVLHWKNKRNSFSHHQLQLTMTSFDVFLNIRTIFYLWTMGLRTLPGNQEAPHLKP